MLRDALWIGVVAAVVGCQGNVTDPGGAKPMRPGPPGPPPDISECRLPNHEIFSGLWGSCVGCHGESSNRPFFADLEFFERQIAYSSVDPLPGETVYVVPGDPDGSELVKLLQGTSAVLQQMPPGQRSYADLLADGDAPDPVTIERIRAWITDLEICELPAPPPQVVARRMPADLIRSELQRQLDLTDAEIAGSGRPLGSPDDSPQRVASRDQSAAHEAWQDLGGAHILDGRRTSVEVSEPMVQTLVPMSQAWCGISVRNKSVLFRHTTRDSDGATERAAIEDNIEYLFLHMLGEDASPDDVAAMFDQVYRPTELEHDAPTAWTAVCATLVRDPLWLTY